MKVKQGRPGVPVLALGLVPVLALIEDPVSDST